jgi:hypothetical protein
MKHLILLFAMAAFISCNSSSESTSDNGDSTTERSTDDTLPPQQFAGDGSGSDKAQEDTLKPGNVIALDWAAAKAAATGSWTDPNIKADDCVGCRDAQENEYAVGYEGCFSGRRLRCEGVSESATSGCYTEAQWKLIGDCK